MKEKIKEQVALFINRNTEILNYLANFPINDWKKVLEGVSVLGIRKLISHKHPPTIETINKILFPAYSDLHSTLTYMKSELSNLTSAIKQLEKHSLISLDSHKPDVLSQNDKLRSRAKNHRANSNKGNKKPLVDMKNRSFTPSLTMFNKDLKEPQVCPLRDAQELIHQISIPRKIVLNCNIQGLDDFVKTKGSYSTQNTSPRFASIINSPKSSQHVEIPYKDYLLKNS